MRPIVLILSLFASLCAVEAESPALLLERAIQLDVAAGKTDIAADLYKDILNLKTPVGRRTRAEALFRLAELRAREKAYDEARNLYTELIRQFPDAQDLIPMANVAWGRVTSLLTQDKFATNPAATQRIGDLVIALRGSLDNAAPKDGVADPREFARAGVLVERLEATLAPLTMGRDALELLIQLKAGTSTVARKLRGEGAEAARAEMSKWSEFDTFMQRGFPSEPHDLFAPAWRLKDKLARALANNELAAANETASQVERYLMPMTVLPMGVREGTLARAIVSAVRDIKKSIAASKWTEARARVDELNEERNEQYPGFQPTAGPLPMRMPEPYVAAEWVVLYFTKLAGTELSSKGVAVALDHIEEAGKICRTVLQTIDQNDAAALFQRQGEALGAAEAAIKGNQIGPAMAALKRAREGAP